MVKLYDSIWLISDLMMQPARDGFFRISESLKLDAGEYMMYDFFLHLVKSFELAQYEFELKISDLEANYDVGLLSTHKSELTEGFGRLFPYPWEYNPKFYPRMRINKNNTNFSGLNFEKSFCKCQKIDRSLKSGASGMQVRCNSCRKTVLVSTFVV